MNTKATRRRMISCYAQIINGYVQGYKIPELVKHEKIKARKLSYASQMYLLMLGQFLHVFSLNELVDISKIHAKGLSRIRGITPANLNTFSNANRTRNPRTAREIGGFILSVIRCCVRVKDPVRITRRLLSTPFCHPHCSSLYILYPLHHIHDNREMIGCNLVLDDICILHVELGWRSGRHGNIIYAVLTSRAVVFKPVEGAASLL